ncbi:MAG: hypothetical protein WCG34_12500, partial [Leptolinea sp.]
MQCPYCQQEHPPGSQFCPLTGKKYCQKCGKPVELIWKKCASCGQSLTTGQNPITGKEELRKKLTQPAS